jgi:hypothetical protein
MVSAFPAACGGELQYGFCPLGTMQIPMTKSQFSKQIVGSETYRNMLTGSFFLEFAVLILFVSCILRFGISGKISDYICGNKSYVTEPFSNDFDVSLTEARGGDVNPAQIGIMKVEKALYSLPLLIYNGSDECVVLDDSLNKNM